MKKIFLSIAFLAVALTASAQDYPGKWEVDLFAGVVPTSLIQFPYHFKLEEKGPLASIYEPRLLMHDRAAYPYVGLRFGYRIYRWLKVGADAGWSLYHESVRYEGQVPESYNCHTVTVIPKVTFHFATSRYVSAYAGVGLGAAFNIAPGSVPDVRPVEFAWQVTPIGITVGRKVPGFTELTVGKDVIGIKFGVGYRF